MCSAASVGWRGDALEAFRRASSMRLHRGLVGDGAAGGRGDFRGDLAQELVERWDGGGVEAGAGDGDVDVEVGDGVVQFGRVLLDPFG